MESLQWWPIAMSLISGTSLLITMLIGFIVRTAVGALRDLRHDHDQVREKVEAVRLLLEGKFIMRDEVNRSYDLLSGKLDGRMLDFEHRLRAVELK